MTWKDTARIENILLKISFTDYTTTERTVGREDCHDVALETKERGLAS
jgi:hypothetical protein